MILLIPYKTEKKQNFGSKAIPASMAARLIVCVFLLCLAAGPFSVSALRPPSCVPTTTLTLNNTVTVVLDPNGGESCFSWNTPNVGGIGVVDHHPPLMVDYYYLFNNDSNICGQTPCEGSMRLVWFYCNDPLPPLLFIVIQLRDSALHFCFLCDHLHPVPGPGATVYSKVICNNSVLSCKLSIYLCPAITPPSTPPCAVHEVNGQKQSCWCPVSGQCSYSASGNCICSDGSLGCTL